VGYVTQNAQHHAEGGAFVIAGVGTEQAPSVFQHGAELQGDQANSSSTSTALVPEYCTGSVLHAIASARHSEPSTRILATISIRTEVRPITLPKLADGSLCRALAMAWSTLLELD